MPEGRGPCGVLVIPMPFIEVKGVEFYYKDIEEPPVLALQDIDFQVEDKEALAIIGPNGSGKSTLAKLFNGLLLPSRGHVMIHGLDTAHEKNLWEIRQQVGMVFQNPDNQLVATMVEEEVAFGPENLGLPSKVIRRRVQEALELVGMEDHAQKPPHALSGGQKQRVAIASIIAMRPQCIVFDEPTAMLDPLGRKEVLDTIDILRREGITIIYITHFLEEVVDCDRIIVLQEGRMILQGTPKEVFRARDCIKGADLEIPDIPYLAYRLQRAGVPIPRDILTQEGLVKAICSLN